MPLLILMAVVFGFLLLVTPFIAIASLVKQSTLRKQLNDLAEENAKQHVKLQRAVGELQAKVAAGVPPATSPAPEKAAASEVRQPIAVPRSFPYVTLPPVVPIAEKKPEPALEAKPQVPPPPALLEPKPAEPKPAAPAPQTPAPTPPKVTPPNPVPHTPSMPAIPPHAAPPAAVNARVSAPSPASPLRTPSPKSTPEQRRKSASAIEEALGANWFAKLGVGMTVIGVALIGKLVIQRLNPAGTAFIVFAVAAFLLGGGIFLEKREKYRLLGRGGIGGGWALLFFCVYGIHHVAAMRILDSLVQDCVLMLVVALAMAAHTLRYKSQFVTGFAFLLGYTTIALSFSDIQRHNSAATSESTAYGLIAGVILAIGLVTIVLRMGWFELEVFGILSSYLNHLYWLYRLLGPNGAHGRVFPEYGASLAILFFYWLTFRISYVLRSIRTDFDEHVSTVSALLNALLLLGLLKFQSVDPDLAYIALLVIGALEFIFAQLPITRRRRAFVILSLLGAALMIVAVPSHWTGNPVAYLWLVGAEVFLFAGII
ncbi:MAG TPA: hypothetical protein VGI46_03200, partial [Candidatus Acidoferrum sp.]